jgi:magnesium transporter
MALGENNEGPEFAVDEWGDVARVASILEDLADEGLITEAMVRLKRLRIADQAEALLRISPEAQVVLLAVLPSEDLGAIIEVLEVEDAVAVCEKIENSKLPEVFDAASPHIAADVLRALEPASAEDVIAEMETAPEVIPLLEYEDDDAGGLMTPEFVALRETMNVGQALDFVRLWAREVGPDPEYLHYLFVVDWDGALKGGLSLAQLVLASRSQFVSLLMDEDIISVGVETDQEEAARLMERYDIFNLPVVDDDGRLVGVVWLDDMIRVLDDEATEDMFRMIGVAEEEKALGPFWRSVRNRLPWLVVNLGTAVLAGFVITLFQSTMGQVVALAAFLPVIAGQGGIAGTQTLTLIIRSITLGEVSPANTRRLLLKEFGLGLVHGLALGLVVGVIAFIWKGSEYLALVVGIAMAANLVVAGISGVIVPLGFRALRIDPALSSAVAVTTLTDVLGFLVYLGLATAAIGLIVGSL